jgi:hypothetical protein
MANRKTTGSPRTGVAALKKELKAAEARWQEQKRAARDAKALAKDAKKAVKKARKALLEAEPKTARTSKKPATPAKSRQPAAKVKKARSPGPSARSRPTSELNDTPQGVESSPAVDVPPTEAAQLETPDTGQPT